MGGALLIGDVSLGPGTFGGYFIGRRFSSATGGRAPFPKPSRLLPSGFLEAATMKPPTMNEAAKHGHMHDLVRLVEKGGDVNEWDDG